MPPQNMRDYYFRLHWFLLQISNELHQRGVLDQAGDSMLEQYYFPQQEEEIRQNLYAFAAFQISGRIQQESSTIGTMVTEAKQYIGDHISSQDLSVSALAEYLGVSASTLSTRFKRTTGMRLIDYIHTVRIQHAEQLLSQTESTIADIAARAGYGSVSTMYRDFQKQLGESPTEFRAKLREERKPGISL